MATWDGSPTYNCGVCGKDLGAELKGTCSPECEAVLVKRREALVGEELKLSAPRAWEMYQRMRVERDSARAQLTILKSKEA